MAEIINDASRQLAVKYNLPEELIERVIRSQFEFIKDTMEKGEYESVHLHHFGKFCVKPKRLETLLKNGYKYEPNKE